MIYTDITNGVLLGVSRVNVTCPFGKVDFWVGKTHVLFHNGIDMTPIAPVTAFERAKVKQIGFSASAGNFVVLSHANGFETLYKHLANGSIQNKVNEIVEKGLVIGKAGATGNVTGGHLHFEIKENGVSIDPLPYLQGKKKIMPYADSINLVRPELPQLNVMATQLNYRDLPNGLRIDTLKVGSYIYLGKTELIDGFEWGQIIVDKKLVYCALNPAWNEIRPILPKPFNAKITQDGQICEVSIKPL